MSGQYRFKPLGFKGSEKPQVSALDRLCGMQNCYKYIKAGDWMVRGGSFDVHVTCASKWCDTHGIEHTYGETR